MNSRTDFCMGDRTVSLHKFKGYPLFILLFLFSSLNQLNGQCGPGEDMTPPNAVCANPTLYVGADGMGSITGFDLDGGSTDNCPGSLALSPDTTVFSCLDVGIPMMVGLTVEDQAGNTSTCISTVTAMDTFQPVVLCQDITVALDASGMASIMPSDVDGGSTDNCDLTFSLDISTFDCTNVGDNTVTLTGTDTGGNMASCTATVTVEDNSPVMASCQDITVQLDPSGMAMITPMDVDNGSSDNCGAMLSIDMSTFDCTNVGPNTVTLTVTNNNGDMASCTATVTVEDTQNPTAVCQDITIQLDGSGMASIMPSDVDGGSSDNCNFTLSVDNSDFDCSNVGDNTVVLTATDDSGNSSTCAAIVTVEDVDPPVAMCMDAVVQLDAMGMASITPADINAGSTDNCGVMLSLDVSTFDCTNVGPNTVNLTATDPSGNSASCSATVTVEDNIPPTAVCQDTTAYLDAAGMASIMPSDVDGGSTDNCGMLTYMVDNSSWTCADIGPNPVTLTVDDGNGNTATCMATVTVADTLPPTAMCTAATIVAPLDGAGMASITTGDVDAGSSDNCMVDMLSLDVMDFTCADIGLNTVTLTVTDASGNAGTCTATVDVQDNQIPIAACVAGPVVAELDANGMASVMPSDIDNGSTDNCPLTLTLDVMDFTCADIGLNTVTLTATDGGGNSDMCMTDVDVQDNLPPTAVCQDITVQLDGAGSASITAADVDGGSVDNCGIASTMIDVSSFDCSNVGPNTVTLTVTDVNGLSSTCTATVTVEDALPPTAACQDVTVVLDAAGMGSTTAADVDAGSVDNCGVASMMLDQTDFDCSHVGPNTVILTVTDVNGNTGTCSAIVTVVDDQVPMATCQDITVELDGSGSAMIIGSDLDNGSTDNCPLTFTPDITMVNCSDVASSPLTVTLTVSDAAGNSDTCISMVTVEDNIPPTAMCQDITVQLDAAGMASIVPSDINNMSGDNCGNVLTDLDIFDFDCSNVGDNTVTLEVTDMSGNTATCTATVTVEDNIFPSITCPADVVMDNAPGFCSADVTISIPMTDDNCPFVDPFLVNDYNGTDNASDTYPVGTTTVTYTVTDASGNSTTCQFDVTINDVEPPLAMCQDVTISLDASGIANVDPTEVDNGSTDNCEIESLTADPASFACADIGDNTVILTVTDTSGNTATCTATATIIDDLPPTAACMDITVDLDANGEAYISFDDVDAGSTDNCSIASIGLVGGTPDIFVSCANQGPYSVTLFVEDGSGNRDECVANLMIVDSTPPTFTNCPSDLTINLDGGECGAFFSYSITAEDACNQAFFSLHQNCSFGEDEFLAEAEDSDENAVVCQLFISEAIAYSRLYDLPSLGVIGDFTVNSVDFVLSFNSPTNPVTVNIYSFPAGLTTPTLGAATLQGTSTITHPLSFSSALNTQAVNAIIPAGEQMIVEIEAESNAFGGTIFGMESSCEELAPTYVRGCNSLGIFPDFTDLDAFFNYGILLQANGTTSDPNVPVVQDPTNEYMSGDFLPIGGPYDFSYTATDMAGNVATCAFSVLVLEYPEEDQIVAMACNDHVQVSLDEDCEVTVGADLILEGGPYGCYDTYTVSIVDSWNQPVDTDGGLEGTQVDGSYIGQILTVTVTDNDTGNSCWGTLEVEDKIIPDLLCGSYEVDCDADPYPGNTANASIERSFATINTTDNAVETETLELEALQGATISDVDVHIESDHTWVGDLVITITSPAGTSVELLNNLGGPGFGCAGNGLDITLDDEATNDYLTLDGTCNNDPAAEGSYQPLNPLSALDGQAAAGTWTLEVEDLAGGDGGSVNVTLDINTTGGLIPFPLPAGAYVSPSVYPADYTGPWTVFNFDPCGEAVLNYYEEEGQTTCDGIYGQVNYRYWTITDENGNTTSCIDTINFIRSEIEDLILPPDWDGIGDNNDPLSCEDNFELDENGHPHPSVTGDIGGPGCFNLNVSYEDVNVPTCANDGTTYKVLRQWTVIDWCTSTIFTHNQTIKVADEEAPIIDADPNIVSVEVQECIYYLDADDLGLTITDNCHDNVEINLFPEEGAALGKGFHDILVQAIDACGNLSEETIELYVRDSVPPVVILDDELHVSLNFDGVAKAEAESFDEGSYDVCGPVAIEVRRKGQNPCSLSTQFGPYVEFCCSDVAISPVQVEVRVTDHSGNSNTGWVYVTVEDKLPPAIICQPDITISCLEDYQQILDNSGAALGQVPAGVTGLIGAPEFAGACNTDVTYTAFGSVDECGFGQIDVTWVVSSESGGTNGCLQRVYVEQFSENRLQCDDIVFPAGSPEAIAFGPIPFCEVNDNENDDDDDQPAVDITDCTGPIITEPVLDNDQLCTAIGINMSADTFNFADGACKKIVVHWEVIDQCVYDENYVDPITGEIDPFNSENGYFEFYGEYNVFDNEAPEVQCVDTVYADCTQDFLGPIVGVATDNCSDPSSFGWSWSLDLHNDGIINAEGAGGEIYAGEAGLSYIPYGEHRVIWNVNDGCGNLSNGNECIFVVVPDDNKAPTPYCFDGIATAVMENNATVTIWAVDFDAGSFDDCDEDLTFTMIPEQDAIILSDDEAHNQSQVGWTFDCSYLPDGQSNEFEVRIYVTDDGGNYDFCRARLSIQDNFDVCPNDGSVTADIAGRIINEHGERIESAEITISSDYPEYPRFTMSDDNGEFDFANNPMYQDYDISSSRDFDYLNGVSTLDLVLIQKYILGQLAFDSPYKVIASDINSDEKVSAIDLLQLRKLILGLYANDDLPANDSWRFVDAFQEFEDINQPWPFDESRTVNNLIADLENQNLIGVKIGDVNGSAQVSGLISTEIRNSHSTSLIIEDQPLYEGDLIKVSFTTEEVEELYGFQFTFNFDSDILEYQGMESGVLAMSEANFGLNRLDEGMLTASWHNTEGVSLSSELELFVLTFKAKASKGAISDHISISSNITRAEAYLGKSLAEANLALEFRTPDILTETPEYTLFQNEPNPFFSETTISFELAEEANATITIYDVAGKVLKVIEGNYAKGFNTIKLDKSSINASGVMYYKLESNDFSATKKMISLD